jgi:hypothetical protein
MFSNRKRSTFLTVSSIFLELQVYQPILIVNGGFPTLAMILVKVLHVPIQSSDDYCNKIHSTFSQIFDLETISKVNGLPSIKADKRDVLKALLSGMNIDLESNDGDHETFWNCAHFLLLAKMSKANSENVITAIGTDSFLNVQDCASKFSFNHLPTPAFQQSRDDIICLLKLPIHYNLEKKLNRAKERCGAFTYRYLCLICTETKSRPIEVKDLTILKIHVQGDTNVQEIADFVNEKTKFKVAFRIHELDSQLRKKGYKPKRKRRKTDTEQKEDLVKM